MGNKWRMKQWGGMVSAIISVLGGVTTSRSTRLDSPGFVASIGALGFIIDGFTALLVAETFCGCECVVGKQPGTVQLSDSG